MHVTHSSGPQESELTQPHVTTTFLLFCHMRQHIHKFWVLEGGHRGWGSIVLPTTTSCGPTPPTGVFWKQFLINHFRRNLCLRFCFGGVQPKTMMSAVNSRIVSVSELGRAGEELGPAFQVQAENNLRWSWARSCWACWLFGGQTGRTGQTLLRRFSPLT